MKTKFKYVTLMAAALLVGFTSCSNDEEKGGTDNSAPKSVSVRVAAPSTYADEATAVGLTPDLNDLDIYFVGSGSVKAKGTMSAADISGSTGTKIFTGIPGSADKVVIIGNAAALSSPNVSSVGVGASETALNALMLEQSAQTHPKTGVNVYGTAAITGAAGAEVAVVTMTPAIARIEIAKVEAKASATIPLTSFELEGIYINNTYTKCGTDYTTLPTLPAEILNYGKTASVWTSAAGTYPSRFCDEFANPAGTSFTPSGTNKWSYYIMPVVAGKGTTIDAAVQSSVPHIVLKIKNATAASATFGTTMYVTVSDIQVAGSSLTALTKGKVYSISTIAIGGENLTTNPITSTQDVTVTATVTAWVDEPSTPVIP